MVTTLKMVVNWSINFHFLSYVYKFATCLPRKVKKKIIEQSYSSRLLIGKVKCTQEKNSLQTAIREKQKKEISWLNTSSCCISIVLQLGGAYSRNFLLNEEETFFFVSFLFLMKKKKERKVDYKNNKMGYLLYTNVQVWLKW